jgi:HPt (histidine-containing phosphotransfer) domain-containing protein
MSESNQPVLDEEQLRRQAMGSDAHRTEILSLFVAEVERLLQQVERARDAQTRRSRLQAIQSLCRNVGAANLGETVRKMTAEPDSLAADLDPLRTAVEEVVAHIARLG